MLEREPIQATVTCRRTRVEQRCVAFAQRHDLRIILKEWKKFAIAPNTAHIQRMVAHAPFAEKSRQRSGVAFDLRVRDFQQSAALRTVVQHVGNRIFRAATSLPAPVSPSINTVAERGAISLICA